MSAERGDGERGVRALAAGWASPTPLSPQGQGLQRGGAVEVAQKPPGWGLGVRVVPGCSTHWWAGGVTLQYPGVEPHPLHGGALSLGLLGWAQQAQRGPEVPPSVVPVPGLVGAAGRAAEAIARLRAGGRWEPSWRGRRGAALAAGGHRLRLDADVGVGGDCEGGPHVRQRAARAGHRDRNRGGAGHRRDGGPGREREEVGRGGTWTERSREEGGQVREEGKEGKQPR